MRVVIAGGTGQVGTILARSFFARGAEVTVFGRHPVFVAVAFPNLGRAHARRLDALDQWRAYRDQSRGPQRELPLQRRQPQGNHGFASRFHAGDFGAAIAAAKSPSPLWLQASTATIYAHRLDAPNDEATGVLGGTEANAPDTWRFSIEVARAWELACDEASVPQTRKVKMRSAMIMSPDPGGIFATLLGLVRLRLGGTAGSGRQFVSWIHHEDFIRAIDWLIGHPELSGAVNLAAPNPLPYADFMRDLRQAAGISIGLPATKWMLEIGAFAMRTETELVLKSRRVVPGRLLESGFAFHYERWPAAADDLCAEWKRHGTRGAVDQRANRR